MPGPFSLLVKKLLGDPSMVDAGSIKDPAVMTPDQAKKFRQLGIAQNDLRDLMEKNTEINFERTSFYREIDRAITYPLIGAALDLYAGVATNYSQLQDATVWITGDSASYVNTLTEMLNFIGCEEKIYDWAWTMAAYGDMFVKIIGVPGQGIVAIEDDDHPLNVSRVDYMGRLIGFYKTPIGLPSGEANGELMPPWEYVHFRILGQKRKRPDYQDPMYTEFRTVSLIAADTRRATTRYGSSMLTNALPVYKKLKLAEDSLLLARLSRGILRNMFKIKVDGNNMDAISEQIQMYSDLLKRAQALDLDTASAKYADNYQAMNVLEDIFVPVWGDIGDLVVDKLGGEADIRFIVDIDELRNQLSCALRVPLQLLGGYCLRGDVKIRLLNGNSVTIKEMTENKQKYVGKGIYACNKQGRVVARKIQDVGITRKNASFVRIMLDNGKCFEVTPDHPCMMRDGSFKDAELLKEGDSLMPLYTDLKKMGPGGHDYEKYYDPESGEWFFTHRMVGRAINGGEETTGLNVHHSNCDSLNNDFSNLEVLSKEEHRRVHFKISNPMSSEQSLKKLQETLKVVMGTEEYKEKLRAGIKKEWARKKLTGNDVSKRTDILKWIAEGKDPLKIPASFKKFMESYPGCRESWNTGVSKDDSRMVRMRESLSKTLSGKGLKERGHKDGCGCACCRKDRVSAIGVRECPKCGKSIEGNSNGFGGHVRWCTGAQVAVLNHKVVRVEKLDVIEDAYDLVIEEAYDVDGGREHCFALEAGVFVHNTKDLPGSLGTSAIERLDIRFAQHARRLQRALIEGVYRLCQIHLAYLNMSPDLTLFEVNMSQNSSAEEEELRESLDKGADVVSKFMDMVEKIENVDKVKVFNYLNEKILKLNDFDLNKMMLSPGQKTNSLPPAAAEGAPAEGELPPQPIEGNQPVKRTDLTEVRRLRETTVRAKHPHNTDLRSFLPMKEGVNNQSLWESTYKSARWKETVVSFKEVKKNVKRK